MKYLLDTDHASILGWPGGSDYAPLVAALNLHTDEGVGLCVVSLHEQALGAHDRINRARTADELVRGYDFLYGIIDLYRQFPLVPFDIAAAAVFEQLRRQKIRIGTMDLRIAATALSRGLTVVTRNTADFGRVPGLRTVDWTR